MEVFSARLKWLRESKGFSQQEMADMLGLSQSYYGRFERNKGEPNLETLAKISSILKESVDFILGIQELTLEAIMLLDNALEQAERVRRIIKRAEELFLNKTDTNKENDLDLEMQKNLLDSYKRSLSQAKARSKESATEFALMAVKIPFSKFYGERVVDSEGNILYDPEKIVDKYQELGTVHYYSKIK
ncbi:helix-turn-helix domain-containing protein [Paenibacillus peoriae]|uniref:helix-turn-helix domain-containing protein n=1 Tax=Paenibacillus peoriae TaxID=59893 RepID=UPI0032AFE7DE